MREPVTISSTIEFDPKKGSEILYNIIITICNELYHSSSIVTCIFEAIFQNKSSDMSGGLKTILTYDRRLKK